MTIDLRSDTVTRPTDAMREAAATATVGDDVYEDDPTVARLERRAAETVGKEAALFVPSGTMGNLAATRVHADRGAERLLDREAHMYRWELGGAAQVNGLQPRSIDCGPRAVPRAHITAAADTAHDLGIPVHLDGARLFNAAVAPGNCSAAGCGRLDSSLHPVSRCPSPTRTSSSSTQPGVVSRPRIWSPPASNGASSPARSRSTRHDS
jgi:threonine aldolase